MTIEGKYLWALFVGEIGKLQTLFFVRSWYKRAVLCLSQYFEDPKLCLNSSVALGYNRRDLNRVCMKTNPYLLSRTLCSL